MLRLAVFVPIDAGGGGPVKNEVPVSATAFTVPAPLEIAAISGTALPAETKLPPKDPVFAQVGRVEPTGRAVASKSTRTAAGAALGIARTRIASTERPQIEFKVNFMREWG